MIVDERREITGLLSMRERRALWWGEYGEKEGERERRMRKEISRDTKMKKRERHKSVVIKESE